MGKDLRKNGRYYLLAGDALLVVTNGNRDISVADFDNSIFYYHRFPDSDVIKVHIDAK